MLACDAQALFMYNRFGEDSPMLEAMSSEEILGTALDDLLDAPGELLNYEHTLAYTGSMPLKNWSKRCVNLRGQ